MLNVARDSMARFGFSPATRVFEAAGAGACLITDAWVGLELFLEPGRRCWWRATATMSREHVGADAGRARAIGEAAAAVLADHTYAHRGAAVERC